MNHKKFKLIALFPLKFQIHNPKESEFKIPYEFDTFSKIIKQLDLLNEFDTISSPQRLDDSGENPLKEIIAAFLQQNCFSL